MSKYKPERIRIKDCPFLNHRIKLLPCQKEMILFWHGRGFSVSQLARLFHIDRHAISKVIKPGYLEHHQTYQKSIDRSRYYNKHSQRYASQAYRQRKSILNNFNTTHHD